MTEILVAVVMGIVEGLTEFIPVSSTGHLIIAGHLLGFVGERAATFELFIQSGAILAVVVLYRRRFLDLLKIRSAEGFTGFRAIGLLAIATIPALILGALVHNLVTIYLFNPFTVAIGLAAGGFVLLVVERFLPMPHTLRLDDISWRQALIIGLFQCLAFWPGVSRSAATIISGMVAGLDRKTSAEFSFLIAVPVLLAGITFQVLQGLDTLQASDILMFVVGLVVAFASAWLAIRSFLRLLANRSLTPFGWYRLVLAVIVLALMGT